MPDPAARSVSPSGLPRTVTHAVTGETVTFLETAEETDGAHVLLEVALPGRGNGPPLHSHLTYTEEFTVLEGVLDIRCGRRRLRVAAGDGVLVPVGQNHTFTNNHDHPVRFTVRLAPAPAFEQSMRIHYGLMADGRTDARGTPRDVTHLALVMWLQDTLVAGVPRRFQRWLLRRLVHRGQARGAYAGFEAYTGGVVDLRV